MPENPKETEQLINRISEMFKNAWLSTNPDTIIYSIIVLVVNKLMIDYNLSPSEAKLIIKNLLFSYAINNGLPPDELANRMPSFIKYYLDIKATGNKVEPISAKILDKFR